MEFRSNFFLANLAPGWSLLIVHQHICPTFALAMFFILFNVLIYPFYVVIVYKLQIPWKKPRYEPKELILSDTLQLNNS